MSNPAYNGSELPVAASSTGKDVVAISTKLSLICTTGDMPFILTDGHSKTDSAKRKLIRHHVMLGKNKGKSRKATRNATSRGSDHHCTGDSDGDPEGTLRLMMNVRWSSVPKRVGSDLSFTRFAAAVYPPFIHDLLKCTHSAFRRYEPCLLHC